MPVLAFSSKEKPLNLVTSRSSRPRVVFNMFELTYVSSRSSCVNVLSIHEVSASDLTYGSQADECEQPLIWSQSISLKKGWLLIPSSSSLYLGSAFKMAIKNDVASSEKYPFISMGSPFTFDWTIIYLLLL